MKTQSILKIVVAAELWALASAGYAAEGTWTRKTDMPTARWGACTGLVGGKIYCIGGGQDPYGTYLSTVEVYDPETETWTQKADMPTRRAFAGASVVNEKIYVVGGAPRNDASTSSVEEYDPATDTWTRKADMPTARNFLSTSTVNGKIYAIGGNYTTNPAAVEEYDPATDTWTRKANMPTPRLALSTSVIDGRIYVIGGVVGSLGAPGLSTVEEYDPLTDTWTRKADMPTARGYLSTCVLNGNIYAIGGSPSNWTGTSAVTVLSTVEGYDPLTDTWTIKPDMPTARDVPSTSVVDGKIYTIGGSVIYWPWTPTSTVEEYDLTTPPPDFNGDGIVNIKDLLRLIESWGQDDPLVDIAPLPFGDSIVDAVDLELLMSYWEQPVDDPTLIAHWALDEAEGNIARDSVAENKGYSDGYLLGDPVWQPTGGQINGAIQLDGIDDCVIASPVLNPADGPFSIFTWINGGLPGQVIISQQDAANWLTLDGDGNLMTELCASGRNGGHLQSETIIGDGTWHRIGFVWDGFYRLLYVDDILAAEDTQQGLASSISGLNIGCGCDSTEATFWFGLIDDIRIYNRVVRP